LAHNNNTAALKDLPRKRCEAVAHSSGHKKGLRAVAILEAVKGLLAIVASFAFLEIVHKNVDLEDAAQDLLYYLHIDPDRHLSHMFVHAAGKVMDANVTLVLTILFVYAAGRLIEGYGLWRQRVWAEWLAIISGAAYLPLELYKLIRHPNWIHWTILLVNIVVVLYIGWVRWEEISARRAVPVRFAEDGD
jgi:uncharacterized membrane protein (DUF2068 family)